MVLPDPGTVYADDPSIPDDELIYRLIVTSNTKWDNQTAVRAGTNAFQDQREDQVVATGSPATAVSVALQSEMLARGTTVEMLLERWGPAYGIASITAGDARANGQGVARRATDGFPEHGIVFAVQGSGKTDSQSKKLAKASKIVAAPPPPSP